MLRLLNKSSIIQLTRLLKFMEFVAFRIIIIVYQHYTVLYTYIDGPIYTISMFFMSPKSICMQ